VRFLWHLSSALGFVAPSLQEYLTVKKYSPWSVTSWRTFVLALIAVGCLGLMARTGVAQEADEEGAEAKNYRVIPAVNVSLPNKLSVLKAGVFANQAEEDRFAEYYKKNLFPRWTDWEKIRPEQSSKDLINVLRRDLDTASKAPEQQVFQKLVELTLAVMPKLAKSKDYHPATRYSAMLMVGEVNTPEAVPMLVDAIKSADQLEAVKAAALVGLIRHANPETPGMSGITDAGEQKQVVDALLALVAQPIPEGPKGDGARWMRGQAAEALGLLGLPGPNGAVVDTLTKVCDDPALSIAQRCRAAQALGRLNCGGTAVNVGPSIDALGRLAYDVLSAEKEPNHGRIKGNLQYVLAGLKDGKGISEAAKQADQQRLEALRKILDPLSTTLNDPRLASDVLGSKIEDAKTALEGAVKKRPK
jgi:HEAT repeat protein